MQLPSGHRLPPAQGEDGDDAVPVQQKPQLPSYLVQSSELRAAAVRIG